MRVDTDTSIHDLTDAEAADLRALCEAMSRGPVALDHPLFVAWADVACPTHSQPAALLSIAFLPRALHALLRREAAVVDLARRLIRSADLKVTTKERARIDCDEEPYSALFSLFYAEEEAARTIPGLVCSECDRNIYKGQSYAGKGGHAAHKNCRNWPVGTVFKIAGGGA